MLEIRLVGTVEAIRDGELVAMPGRRIRALLAMLALTPGETVSIDSLAAGIWDDEPPERVRGSLHTYVARLRRLLGEDVIATRPTGYACLVPRRAVDLLTLWDSALEAGAVGAPADERAALAAILERWQGAPFGDAPSDWLARHERTAWVERHLHVFERWVDLSFELGDHRSCLEELNRQVNRYPLHEPLWGRLLTALDRIGRTAEALNRYETVRKRLAEELGVDPSPDLRAVYATLLERSDEGVSDGLGDSRSVVPRQLPASVRGFVGRDDQIVAMDRVQARSAGNREGAVLALHGLAGSGKTSLALHWAHRVKGQFPDGQLFLDLQGYGTGEPMRTEQALGALLRGLGVPGKRIPDDVDDRSAMLRSETEGRRMLIVLDNARESEQVRPLLPGSDAVVLVTSRTQLRGLAVREAAYRVRVDPMSPDESIALLQRRSVGGVGAEELRELAELCGNLPVALAVAAERIGRDGLETQPVGALIAELEDHKSRLGALASGDDQLTNVRAVLDWSYHSLDDESARVLRLLGLYTAPLISTGAVAALVGIDPAQAARRIDRLTDHHLLTPNGDGYLAMHGLVHDFAAEVADEEPESERRAATRRVRSWFLHATGRARIAWSPRIAGYHLPDPEPGVIVEDFDSPQDGFAWLDTNGGYLRGLVDTCVLDGDATGHQLAPLLSSYLQSSGMTRDSLELFQRAEESARRLGDRAGQAACANATAGCHFERAEMDSAAEAVERARDLCAAAGDFDGELRAQGNLAVALHGLGRVDKAVEAFERAISEAREVGARGQLGWNLFNASETYLSIGWIDDALRAAVESVEVLALAHRSDAHALAVDNLGEIQAADGQRTDAVETMSSAIEFYRALYMRTDEAGALRKLGIFHRDLGNTAVARECWDAALSLLAEIGVSATKEVSRAELRGLIESLDEPLSEAEPAGRSDEA